MGPTNISKTYRYISLWIIRIFSHLEDKFRNALMEIRVSALLMLVQDFFFLKITLKIPNIWHLKFENLALSPLEELNKCIQKVFFITFWCFCFFFNIQVKIFMCVYSGISVKNCRSGLRKQSYWDSSTLKNSCKDKLLRKTFFFLQRYCQNCYNILSQTEKNSTIA